METYAEVPMDFADASLVALAEALHDFRIVTFDNDFRVYRAAGGRVLFVFDSSA
jgi:predicted nucleic acid-binding protein